MTFWQQRGEAGWGGRRLLWHTDLVSLYAEKEGGKQHETFSGYERSSQGVLEYESTSAHHCFYLQKERKWSPVISNTLFRRGRCRQSRNAALKLSVYF